jgi:hypothetical protein
VFTHRALLNDELFLCLGIEPGAVHGLPGDRSSAARSDDLPTDFEAQRGLRAAVKSFLTHHEVFALLFAG